MLPATTILGILQIIWDTVFSVTLANDWSCHSGLCISVISIHYYCYYDPYATEVTLKRDRENDSIPILSGFLKDAEYQASD